MNIQALRLSSFFQASTGQGLKKTSVRISDILRPAGHRPLRAKLIFNANSGKPEASPQQLVEILSEMQVRQINAEVHMVQPDEPIEAVARTAIRAGTRLIVVAGGDGTIDSVAGALVGSPATLGIIPTGTRNNLALNLGIPENIREAVALLRDGHQRRIDVGHIQRGRTGQWFLEAATLGLLSDIYPLADKIQHGDLAQIGELLSTFFQATPSRLRLILDGRRSVETSAHMLLVSNMAFIGPHFRVSPKVSFKDRRLDVFTFSDMTKLNMVSYFMQAMAGPVAEHPNIKHYRVKHLDIRSSPQAPVLADGVLLGQGRTTISVHPSSLKVMTGSPYAGEASPGETIEKETAIPNG